MVVSMAKKKCKPCGKTFDSNTTWQKFCSNACRQRNKRKKAKGK
jgi:predicted nucleic acid-binding Zn ribbon protein